MTLNASQPDGMRFPHFVDFALAFSSTLQGQEVACVLEKCHLFEVRPAYQRVFQHAGGEERRGH